MGQGQPGIAGGVDAPLVSHTVKCPMCDHKESSWSEADAKAYIVGHIWRMHANLIDAGQTIGVRCEFCNAEYTCWFGLFVCHTHHPDGLDHIFFALNAAMLGVKP